MLLADGTCQDLANKAQEPAPKRKFPLDSDGLPRPTGPTLEKIIARQEAPKDAAYRDAPVPPEPLSPILKPSEPFYRADPIVVPIDPEVAAFEFPEEQPPTVELPRKPRAIARPRRPRRPRRERFSMRLPKGKGRPRCKGFGDPLTYEGARLYAWTYYRLKALNLQLAGEICAKHEELETLQQEVAGVKVQAASEDAPSAKSLRQTTVLPERKETIMPTRNEPIRVVAQPQAKERTTETLLTGQHNDKPP